MEDQQWPSAQIANKINPFKIATIILSVAVLGLGGLSTWLIIDNSNKNGGISDDRPDNGADTGEHDTNSPNNSGSQIDTSSWKTTTFRSGMTDKYLEWINADWKQFSVTVKYPADWCFRYAEADLDNNGKVTSANLISSAHCSEEQVGIYKNLGQATNKDGSKYIKTYPHIFLKELQLPSKDIYHYEDDPYIDDENSSYSTITKLGNTSTDGYWIASETFSYDFERDAEYGNSDMYIWITNANESILDSNGKVTATGCSLTKRGVFSAYPNGDTTATILHSADIHGNTKNYKNVLEVFRSAVIKI